MSDDATNESLATGEGEAEGTTTGEGLASAGLTPDDGAAAEPSAFDVSAVEDWPAAFKDVPGLAKGYNELQKKLHQRDRAPENYEFDVPEGLELTDDLTQAMRDLNMTNDQAEGMAKLFADTILPEVVTAKRDAEMAKLGSELGLSGDPLQAEIDRVAQFALKHFGEEYTQEFDDGTAAGFLHLKAKMDKALAGDTVSTTLRGGAKPEGTRKLTKDEIQRRVFDPRYSRDSPQYDPTFVRETERLVAESMSS